MLHPLQIKLSDYQVVLASGSPRRKELLKGLDIDFTVEKPPFDENYPSHLTSQHITEYIVKQKANYYKQLAENTLVILADTMVWFNQKPLMKPENEKEAIAMLHQLSGKTHIVFTSVCIKNSKKEIIFTEQTKVTFKNLSESEINYYVKQYKPFDKAGAYAIQEWIGYIGIEKIDGCYYNIMGLPLQKLYSVLMTF